MKATVRREILSQRHLQRIVCSAILITGVALADSNSPVNLLKDAGFEQPVLSNGWSLDPHLFPNGLGGQSIFAVHSGRYSLRLVPNANNVSGLGKTQFGVGQALDATPYRGKPLYFSGWMGAFGGATAVLRLVAVSSTGAVWYRELRQGGHTLTPVFQQDILDVPDDPTIQTVVMTCQVDGVVGSAWFDDVMVSTTVPPDWIGANGQADPGSDLAAAIDVDASNVIRTIPRTLYGINAEWIWNGNGLWDTGTNTLNPVLVNLTSSMGASILRFPGGFFSDFYHWKDGVGPIDARPPGRTLAPGEFSPNSFGTDEVLQLATTTGSQVLFTVNVLTGTPDEAAAWVKYVNNGSRYVQYWEIGNEPYVDLRQFDPAAASLTPEDYANRFLAFARAMKAVDPTIKVGAALDFNYGYTTYRAYPDWADKVLQIAGSEIDFVAVHNGFSPVLGIDAGWPARVVYESMMATPQLVSDTLAALQQKIDTIMGKDSHIMIGVSEWGPLFSDKYTSRFVDHVKTLGSALYVASMLKVYIENPRVELATAFKLVDYLAMGWIGIRNGQFAAKAPYYALEMYAKHFGTQLVSSQTESPGYNSRSMGWVDAVTDVPYLYTVASTSDDGTALYLMVTNRHFDRNIAGEITVRNFCPNSSNMDIWTLNGTAVDANTGTQIVAAQDLGLAKQAHVDPGSRFDKGGPDEVWLRPSTVQASSPVFTYTFPAHSVTSIKISGNRCTVPLTGTH